MGGGVYECGMSRTGAAGTAREYVTYEWVMSRTARESNQSV